MNYDLPNISKELDILEKLIEKQKEIGEIEYSSPDAKKYYKKLKKINLFIDLLTEIKNLYIECSDLINLNDDELKFMIEDELQEKLPLLSYKLTNLYSKIQNQDINSCDSILIEMRAGTGGDEASLFVSELLKIYLKFAEDNKIKTEIIDMSKNELNGIKSCSILFEAEGVMENFMFESGVHRVQRVPKTEANGRIHTSTISVSVLPFEEDSIIEIDAKDLRIDTYRAGGAGGQHVNRTDSAVRLTHIPSGIVVQCQDERSQIKNKDKAMKVLKTKLQEQNKSSSKSELNEIRESHIGNSDRSEKCRTYNYPQNRITDHRYDLTLYQLEIIMSGNFQLLLDKLLSANNKKQLEQQINIDALDLI